MCGSDGHNEEIEGEKDRVGRHLSFDPGLLTLGWVLELLDSSSGWRR